MTDC